MSQVKCFVSGAYEKLKNSQFRWNELIFIYTYILFIYIYIFIYISIYISIYIYIIKIQKHELLKTIQIYKKMDLL